MPARPRLIPARWRDRAALAALGATLLAGCSPLALQPAAPAGTYVLEAPQVGAPLPDPAGPSLLVEAPGAAAGYDSAEMVYVRQAHQLEHFAHHRWADAPARMLEPLLVDSAAASGLFRTVISGRGRAGIELRLDTELVLLRQEFLQQPSRVRLVLRAHLLETRSGSPVASRRFEVEEPAPADTPYGGVLAANRAVARLLHELQGFLRSAVGQAG
jgi:cholesterol transport system auxiliary component